MSIRKAKLMALSAAALMATSVSSSSDTYSYRLVTKPKQILTNKQKKAKAKSKAARKARKANR